MQLRPPHLAAALGVALLLVAGAARCEDAAAPLAQAIHALIDQAAANPAGDQASVTELRRFYEPRNYAAAWVDDPARVAALAAILAGASDRGLAFSMPRTTGGDARRDVALTQVALDYATALAAGRVRPDQIETDWSIEPPSFDAPARLGAALSGDLVAWYAGLEPTHPAYERLIGALARYQKIAANGGWPSIPRGDPLKIGAVDERVRLLRQRLVAEGDLAPEAAAAPAAAPRALPVSAGSNPIRPVAATNDGVSPSAVPYDPQLVFDGDVAEAVQRFQRRYGIAVDGAVGPRTLAAMNVPVRARIEQIKLNLERWRALPHDFGASYLMVNVPAEQLDVVNHGTSVITMKVVVGDPDHPTPVVRSTMVAVTLNPVWSIPSSIVTKELLPKAKRDPSYLAKNDIVLTPGRGWQQLPGPKNPLGQIKFESPNRFDVYLHDTPSHLAFDRYFRAQSHGCVRLERAPELADYVLDGTGWNASDLADAVATGANRHIELKRRWRIYLVYATSFVDDDGAVEFRDDLYGRDARLRAALAALRPAHAQKQTGL